MAAHVRVSFLGGLGEIGRNCTAIEVDDRIMLIDCGLMFPAAGHTGVDLILPDFRYLLDNAERVEGVVLTHGHEDHIGAVSFLLKEMPLKIIGSSLTLGIAKHRIEERGVADNATFIEVADGQRVTIGGFDMEFFPVTHSVPHGFATAFYTPQGVILHSGDFKLDMAPVDQRLTDLAGFGHLAKSQGVRLFLCDSTNAEQPGFSVSETVIGHSIKDLFRARHGRRIIVACFASHIHRIQQIADAAVEADRVVVTVGRSMNNIVAMAQQMGYLQIPSDHIMRIEDSDSIAPGDMCVISTGSQGEPLSALARMASGDNKWLSITDDDCVIMSSHPIPGNESSVARVIDGLVRRGAEVIHSEIAAVHTTGHAKAEELRVMHSIVQPEWFVPVHGEYRHLAAHLSLVTMMGMDPDRAMLCLDGDSLVLTDDGLSRGEPLPADYIYMAGTTNSLTESVLQERGILGQDGFVTGIVTVSLIDKAEIVDSPKVLSRGWVDGEKGELIRREAVEEIRESIETALEDGIVDRLLLEKVLRRSLGRFIKKRTGLRPMVVPILIGAEQLDT